MKRLIYRDNIFYISDDISDKQGKTRKTKYKASLTNLPHQYFRDYVVVYGRLHCPYCIKTLELLKDVKKSLFVEIDTEPHDLFDKSKLLELLHDDIGNHSTVPIVYDKGRFIGGSSDVEKLYSK